MATPPVAIVLDLGSTYGVMFIAAFIATGLWGMSCVQTFTYFINYPGDHLILKLMVAWLWLMDTTHQVVLNKGLYKVLILHFGSITAITTLQPEFTVNILFTVLGSTVAQLFFTYRVWMFSGKKWFIPGLLVPSVVAQFVVQTVYMSSLLKNPTLDQIRASDNLAIAFDAMAAVTDVGIACCMVYLLLQEPRSNQLVKNLVVMTINSGLWTALVALAVVITLVAIPPPSLTFGAVYTCLSPIYCNTVLANLNSRNYLRQVAGSGHIETSSGTPGMPFGRLDRGSETDGFDQVRFRDKGSL